MTNRKVLVCVRQPAQVYRQLGGGSEGHNGEPGYAVYDGARDGPLFSAPDGHFGWARMKNSTAAGAVLFLDLRMSGAARRPTS